MLFLTYWELNENMASADRLELVRRITSSGLFPPEGLRVVRWDMTPDGWGVLIAEAETAAAMSKAVNVWRTAAAGFFKRTKTAPIMPVQESMKVTGGLLGAIAATQRSPETAG